ncbi:MAG: hypothetical protein H0W96_08320 [Solirubrobacterales bacterium]|nr:hypothetical protein [Solirubrobacterales bacterium]
MIVLLAVGMAILAAVVGITSADGRAGAQSRATAKRAIVVTVLAGTALEAAALLAR